MTSSQQPKPEIAPPPATMPTPRLRGWALATVLASLMLALFLSGLDQIIVDTALPRIIGDLHGFDRYTWVVTAYLLASTAMIPIAGKLSDQFGRKWLLIAAIALFFASSALAGASQTMNDLIVFRGLQGLSAGVIQTLVFTLVADIFPPTERARWQGLTTGIFALASVVGPTAGGWITDNLGWRFVFFVNVPLDVLAVAALLVWLPANISARATSHTGWSAIRRIDILGALAAAIATICLLLGLTWGGQTYPWRSPQVIGMLVAAGVLFTAFLVNERFAAEPILPLRLARNQVFAAGSLLSLTSNMALVAMLVYIALFIQGVLGQSATSSGVAVTPLTVTITISAIGGGLLVSKTKRYQWVVVLGSLILVLGAFLMTRLTVSSSPLDITRNMVVVGLGVGLALPVISIAVQNAIPRSQLGAGTGAMSYLRSLGQTLGVAIVGTVVNNTAASELSKRLPSAAHQLPPAALTAATSQQVLLNPTYQQTLRSRFVQTAIRQTAAQVPVGPQHDQAVATITAHVTAQVTQLLDQIFAATRQSLAIGIEHAFIVALGICAVTFLITFFLKDIPLKPREQEQSSGAAPTDSVSEKHVDVAGIA